MRMSPNWNCIRPVLLDGDPETDTQPAGEMKSHSEARVLLQIIIKIDQAGICG